MGVVPAVFGFIAAVPGLIAVVARFQVEPLYSMFVAVPSITRRLQRARDAVAERRRLRIVDDQDTLELVHQVATEENEYISEQ